MKRVKAQSIGEILREFFAQNPEIGRRLDEVRLVHAWREVLGPGVAQATCEAPRCTSCSTPPSCAAN